MNLDIDQIMAVKDCQARVSMNEAAVLEYLELLEGGSEAPDVTTFYDGEFHWLADGFHRLESYRRAKRTHIGATVIQGNRRDARLFACSANPGLRRTNADKRKAVEMLLKDEEWRQMSDEEISRRAGVSKMTVGRYRAQLGIKQTTRKGADGKTRRLPTPVVHASGATFNLSERVRELDRLLDLEFDKWTVEKHHYFCVRLRCFSEKRDPEFPIRKLGSVDNFYRSEAASKSARKKKEAQ